MEVHALVCRRDRTYASIGEEFGITAQRVHQIAKAMDQRLFQEMAESIGELKSRQTVTLRHVAREAMARGGHHIAPHPLSSGG